MTKETKTIQLVYGDNYIKIDNNNDSYTYNLFLSKDKIHNNLNDFSSDTLGKNVLNDIKIAKKLEYHHTISNNKFLLLKLVDAFTKSKIFYSPQIRIGSKELKIIIHKIPSMEYEFIFIFPY